MCEECLLRPVQNHRLHYTQTLAVNVCDTKLNKHSQQETKEKFLAITGVYKYATASKLKELLFNASRNICIYI